MKINGKHYRTIWTELMNHKYTVNIINQNRLPDNLEILSFTNYKGLLKAVKGMNIRGAGAIGAATAYALSLAIENAPKTLIYDAPFMDYVKRIAEEVKNTRPTAMDLFHSVDAMLDKLRYYHGYEFRKMSKQIADNLANINADACLMIGHHGSILIKPNARILTHCNAGWLAFVDYGSALSPIYAAKERKPFVYASETRPRMQGSLTAFELMQEGIDCRLIVDNAAGALLRRGNIDMVIVGADRIAGNGDVVNKIGTYMKAVLAKENHVPFYVAAPLSTFDLGCRNGDDVIIEERSGDEVAYVEGFTCYNGFPKIKARIAPVNASAFNPGFDVTPARYVSAYITEKGFIGNYDKGMNITLERRIKDFLEDAKSDVAWVNE